MTYQTCTPSRRIAANEAGARAFSISTGTVPARIVAFLCIPQAWLNVTYSTAAMHGARPSPHGRDIRG